MAETDEEGRITRAYGFNPHTQQARTTEEDEDAEEGSLWSTDPIWQADLAAGQSLKEASYHYLVTDHLGVPVLALNKAGEATWKANYEAFGKARVNPASTAQINLRLPGQYFDAETGLHQNWNRDYAPGIGRYVQADPIGLAGGVNVYQYAYGNPMVYYDPYGLFGWSSMPPLPQGLVDFSAGWGDSLSFGITRVARSSFNLGADAVNICSTAYRGGSYFGHFNGLFLGIGGASQAYIRGITVTTVVTRWGRPGLQAKDWVMEGPKTYWNYINSYKWQPGMTNTFAKFKEGESFYNIRSNDLRYAPGFWKGFFFGQKKYAPGASGLPAWIYDATKYSAYGSAQIFNGGECGC